MKEIGTERDRETERESRGRRVTVLGVKNSIQFEFTIEHISEQFPFF